MGGAIQKKPTRNQASPPSSASSFSSASSSSSSSFSSPSSSLGAGLAAAAFLVVVAFVFFGLTTRAPLVNASNALSRPSGVGSNSSTTASRSTGTRNQPSLPL